MEEQMNNILKGNSFMPSLEHRALIKTTIALWNPGDIQLDDIQWRDGKWIAEDRVIGKVKELLLPESLKKKILAFIKPIGFEILKWTKYYQKILSGFEIKLWSRFRKSLVDVKKVEKSLSKLCWTPQGTVDRKKTAEELIRDENLDITERYKLACIYCFRNDILMLWNKMPEYCRKSFYSEEDPRHVQQNELVVFWTYDIKGELSRMNGIFEHSWHSCTPYEYAFECAVECNIVATEYFWQNLTSEERVNCMVNTAGLIYGPMNDLQEDNGDVLFFLLSQMNEEQKIEMLKKYSWKLLSCLLSWPCQDFFMETAELVSAFLSGDGYLNLLENILDKVKNGYKDYDYKKLFREFWQKGPITHKEYVKDKFSHNYLLYDLVEIEDEEYVKIMFASIPGREKFLLTDDGINLCGTLILSNKMDLLEFLVRECVSSKDIIMRFREEFKNYVIHHYSKIKDTPEEKSDTLGKFFQLLDELILEDDNRKRVDEGNTDSAAKRLCSHVSKE